MQPLGIIRLLAMDEHVVALNLRCDEAAPTGAFFFDSVMSDAVGSLAFSFTFSSINLFISHTLGGTLVVASRVLQPLGVFG